MPPRAPPGGISAITQLSERVTRLETWADGKERLDKLRDERIEERHTETQKKLSSNGDLMNEVLDEIRSTRTDSAIELSGIRETVRKIELQTADDRGAERVRKGIRGGIFQILLAVLSGGVLTAAGRWILKILGVG